MIPFKNLQIQQIGTDFQQRSVLKLGYLKTTSITLLNSFETGAFEFIFFSVSLKNRCRFKTEHLPLNETLKSGKK